MNRPRNTFIGHPFSKFKKEKAELERRLDELERRKQPVFGNSMDQRMKELSHVADIIREALKPKSM